MKRVIMTGPTGEIGNALINKLILEGIEITAICRPNSHRLRYLPKSDLLTVIECDAHDIASLQNSDKLKDNYDVFYHFGWISSYGPETLLFEGQIDNIKYEIDTINLASFLKCKRFVSAGSQAEYGPKLEPISPLTPTTPCSPYGFTKLYCCNLAAELCNKLSIEHVHVRICSIYGPYDGPYTLVSYIMKQIKSCQDIELTKCEQIWDYLYSEDAAEAFWLIGKSRVVQPIYCLGSGHARPLMDYISDVEKFINENQFISKCIIGAKEYSKNQTMYLCADISSLQEDTGFIPHTNFYQGICKTYTQIKLQK